MLPNSCDYFFFFSSRRRHTRWPRDWSSDVCSSDLTVNIEHEKIPSELSVYIDPKTIDVDIEERATEQFPISVDFIDEDKLPVGYELGEAEVKPEVAEVTSAKSVMEQIGIVKVYIDVADLDESVNNREVPINVYDNQGNALSVKSDQESEVVSVDVDNQRKTVPINDTITVEYV